MKVHLEFSGGLELLFGKKKQLTLELDQETIGILPLIQHIRDHLLKERPELFVVGNSVRPGILVLINDCDWELEGGTESIVRDGDKICFISTLHGG
ncbi:unnamed protein product [Vitrella brassicaformis CCMP3155]|uniref:Ubiquitin-related modifier 1 homolog n=1 Tax=Vitrella brassicaformis (strain CCMP3155) TaxID=1169540 RepID=A0A0G4EHZ3_VITBC|nr:unnamed protein product [Vitrella brassicaformis CCMP3155]|eukprot:CEL95580.1 unnamed protein product [Vitrella brassicaformis CCMP3155]